MNEREPLDLRLLPAAISCWAAALLAVHSTAAGSLRLAAALGLLAVVALLLLPLGRRSPRIAAVLPQLLLCAGLAAGVALSAAQTHYGHQASGWNQAVESEAPVEVTFRVTRDSHPFAPRGDQQAGYRTEAVVISHRSPGAEHERSVTAEVLIFSDAELRAGHRYRALVSAAPTASGDRTTALLRSFGDQSPQQLPPDARSRAHEVFNELRSATRDHSRHGVGDAPALLPGVILGDRSGMSPELTEAMRVSGLTHLTVVSGTHTSLVLGALLGLARMMRMPRWGTVPLLLVGLLLFVMLVQPAPSVIRASVMGAIGALAVFAGRGRASSALLLSTVILLLGFSPWFAVQAAFQLSVAATLGIVLIGARLNDWFSLRLPRIISGPLALAVSAQLFVTPVLLPLSEGVTLYSVPANIVAAPLLPLATIPGTLAAVVSTTLPWGSAGLLWLAGFPAAGIAAVGRTTAELPQALAPWPEGPWGWVLAGLYTAAAVVLSRLVITARRRPGWSEGLLLSAAAGGLAAVIIPGAVLWGLLGGGGPPQHWRFALCDVDQGDMLVIRTGEDAAVVVDAGEEPAAAAACLRQLEVNQVPMLMITHDHLDHYGGTAGVYQVAQIHQILYSGTSGWSVLDAVAETDGLVLEVPERRAELGETLEDHRDYPVTWSVWSAPDYHPNPNDNSLVVAFELWDAQTPAGAVGSAKNPLRLLALGDLEEEIAAVLLARGGLPQHIDVLKVSHHGAANGGTELLEHAQPEVALIGVGEQNSYGHPAEEILRTLQDLGAAVYRTDLHGTVVFSMTPEGLEAVSISR